MTIPNRNNTTLSVIFLFLALMSSTHPAIAESPAHVGSPLAMDDHRLALYRALRTDLPALRPVHKSVAAGNMDEARRLLVAHFRQRTQPHFIPAPDSLLGASRIYADLALEGRVFAPPTGIEPWLAGPGEMWSKAPQGQDQWAVALNRHQLWIWLAKTYADTRDRRYLDTLEAQILDWSATMPVHIGTRFIEGLAEEPGRIPLTLNAGLRMGRSWFYVFDTLKADLSDQVIEEMLFWMREHGNFLLDEKHFAAETNWGVMQATGLFTVGLMLPEFQEAAVWRKTAEERFMRMLSSQAYPDGVQMELSPGYHAATAELFSGSLQLAEANKVELPASLRERIEKMDEVPAKLMAPDWKTPAFNDSNRVPAESLANAVTLFPKNKLLRFAASRGQAGSPPDFTSCDLPWAGWRVMRSGWTRDDLFLCFDSGPLGVEHYHEDKLHFILHAGGEELISEFGTHAYDGSPWQRYGRGAYSHNTVLIDGCGQRRIEEVEKHRRVASPAENGIWQSNQNFDYARGSLDDVPFGDGTRKMRGSHTREILHVRDGGFVIIADTLSASGTGDHVFEALFHHPGAKAAIRENPLRVEVDKKQAALTLVPLLLDGCGARIVQGQKEPYLLGWSMTGELGHYRPEPVSVFQRQGSGIVRMAWLLLPHRAGSPPALASLAVVREPACDLIRWRNPANEELFLRLDHDRSGLAFLQRKRDGTQLRYVSTANP